MLTSEERKEILNLHQRKNDLADAAERASASYSARMQLYNVAASANDTEGMELERNALHTLLDVILDSGAMIAQAQTNMLKLIEPNNLI